MEEEEENPKILILSIRTLTNDFGGIYDYSEKAVKSINGIVLDSTYVVRDKNNNFEYIKQHSDIPREGELIFHVLNDNISSFFLINPIPKKLELTRDNLVYINNKIWFVINSDDNMENDNNNGPYYLNENDVIKLGKVKFVVKKIYIKNSNIENDPPIPVNDFLKYDVSKLNKDSSQIFGQVFETEIYSKNKEDKDDNNDNEQEEDGETPSAKLPDEQKKIQKNNRKCILCQKETFKFNNNSETDAGENGNLISLCKCKEEGLVHLGCLREKLHAKVENKGIDKEITIENFECPNCKEQYPLKFKYKNELEEKNLIEEYKEPEDDFLILESLDYYIDEKICKTIHIIKLVNEIITIGRDPENDVIEKDISISRFHAVLKYNKMTSKICIVNKSKKFGTLVLIKKPLKILDEKIHLQVGRSYIIANLKLKNE